MRQFASRDGWLRINGENIYSKMGKNNERATSVFQVPFKKIALYACLRYIVTDKLMEKGHVTYQLVK